MYDLLFLSGARAGVTVPVGGQLLVGRDASCSLEVPDPRVSRSHARIDWDGVHIQVTDTGSSNGTYVNEQPVMSTRLQHGDVVRFGTTRLAVRRRGQVGDGAHRGSVFGFRDSTPTQASHTVSVTRFEEPAAARDVAVLQRRLRSLMAVAEMLAKQRSLDELYGPVLDVLFDQLPQTDRGFLMLGDRTSTLVPVAMRQRGSRTQAQLVVSRSICRAALEKKAAFLYREGGDEPIDAGHSVADLHIRSAVAVPLVVADDVVGVVVLDSRDARRAFTDEDLELAAAIGQQVAIAIRHAQLLRRVEQQTVLRNNLMRFLPEAMANQVLNDQLDAGLGGRRYRGTVLFSDLIGFTARAEAMGPEELVAFMNRYFNRLVPCVEHESGSVDKFMGDAIMAVWGIPTGTDRAAPRAAAAALAMQTQLAAFHSELAQPLHMGVGICTGDVVAGNIGAVSRREYTVLGDPVNTAQRIGAAACLEQVLVADTTWAELSGRGFGVRMPPLQVKNKSKVVQTYSLRGLAVEDGEVALFLPVQTGAGKGYLVRRLVDGSFLLLHQGPPLEQLAVQTVELEGLDLGRPKSCTPLAQEATDGALRRAVVQLADPTLGGLLSPTPPRCERSWTEMSRTATAVGV
jgi:adenylate cyclase